MIQESMGRVGLPAPVSELAARTWDVVVVGGGHNGLACAAYLAKAGRSVLVLERRDRLGGACTLEQPFTDPGYTVSPCAYVVGLLDQRVIDELQLRRHGYRVFVAEPLIWCPFDDGTWYAQFLDDERTAAGMRENGFSDAEIKGQFDYEHFFDRMRRALREGTRDTWVGDSPSEDELRALLDHDPELVDALFETSIADVLDRFVDDPRLTRALYGQGVIGAWAGPRSPGTASIKLMHYQGTLEGVPMAWGYVQGGMGRISFAIAEAAEESGATLASGVAVAEIRPGEGVVLEGGELILARAVVSNADPKVTAGLLGSAIDDGFAARMSSWRTTSPVVKLNCGLSRLPRWTALPVAEWPTWRQCRSPCRWTTRSGRSKTAPAASRHRVSPSCTSSPPTTRRWPRPESTRCRPSCSTRRTSWPRARGTNGATRSVNASSVSSVATATSTTWSSTWRCSGRRTSNGASG